MASANQPMAVSSPRSRRRIDGYPASSRWLDVLSIVTSAAFLTGLFVDGWAHNTIPELETFFTPWHGILYGGFFSVALLMGFTQYRNVGKGYAWSRAVPEGYGLSLVGIGLFLVGGIGDMLWHETFGIEQNLEALFSPTHLLLATGAFLFISGPLRAAWRRSGLAGWGGLFPAVCSASLLLAFFSFFTQYASVYANAGVMNMPTPLGSMRYFTEVTSVVYLLVPAALMMGMLLLLVRRWTLPFGAATVMFTANALLMFLMRIEFNRQYGGVVVAALLSGLLTDTLIAWLRPSAARHHMLRLVAFLVPFTHFLLVLAAVVLSNGRGLWWEIHSWLGVPFITGVIGVGISFLLVPPLMPPD